LSFPHIKNCVLNFTDIRKIQIGLSKNYFDLRFIMGFRFTEPHFYLNSFEINFAWWYHQRDNQHIESVKNVNSFFKKNFGTPPLDLQNHLNSFLFSQWISASPRVNTKNKVLKKIKNKFYFCEIASTHIDFLRQNSSRGNLFFYDSFI